MLTSGNFLFCAKCFMRNKVIHLPARSISLSNLLSSTVSNNVVPVTAVQAHLSKRGLMRRFETAAEISRRHFSGSSISYSSDSKDADRSQITEPFIPVYEPRTGESVETMKARLLYQSRKRGMLENDLLLSTFAAKFLDSMSEAELKEYDRLINLPSNDWDLYYWATGVKPVPEEFNCKILQKFIEHVRNPKKESRIRQPDLTI